MSVFTNPAAAAKQEAEAYIAAILDTLADQEPLTVLEASPAVLDGGVAGLTKDVLRAPEAPGKWSMLETIQHLADSELVWAYRLRMVLAQDKPDITGYDQDLWAKRLNYQTSELSDALAQFKLLRAANLRLLRSLSAEELQRVGLHKERGEESVQHMMRLYAGHDLVHLRQLSRIRTKVRRSQSPDRE
ncbi:MAG: DinB family protein [bacterium]